VLNRLDPAYNFDEFVVGPHNRFPHAAAQSVAENPGKAYNPLFLYGPVGLGKTHLMQAIGHRTLEKNPKAQILYISAEHFINEVIELLQSGELKLLREKYRALDMLLVDDVQFLANSESTQEEFFHIFNDLHQAGRQIILTSDRPPKLLTTLEDRLRSRFEWGLTADIKPPNLETRVAILKKKESRLDGVSLEENIRLYIAGKLKSNVRELEGFLRRVQAYAQLNSREINLPMVKEIMRDLLPPEEWDEEDKVGMPMPAPPAEAKRPAAAAAPARTPPPVVRPPAPAAVPEPSSAPENKVVPAVAPGAIRLDGDALPPVSLSAASSRAAASEQKAIPVIFFFPKGKDAELNQIRNRFTEIIKKHKLKFSLEPLAAVAYPLDDSLSAEAFPAKCMDNNVRIAIVLGPPPENGLRPFDVHQKLQEAFEAKKLSLQLIPWEELSKDYRYLNLALDITLIRYKEKDAP